MHIATVREQEILAYIAKNPLATQQEIGRHFGIARASVAVHISNLTKKGLIQGRGYVVKTEPYIAVVGGANMDIRGASAASIVPRDSNPGTVSMSAGGVGRNIAHNLALLGQNVSFVSVFAGDEMGKQLAHSCLGAGIDIAHCPTLPHRQSSVYLAVTGPEGDMDVAISDMDLYDEITPDFLQGRMHIINSARLCVTDTNLSPKALQYLVQHCTVPLFADAVSTTKAEKLKNLLPYIHTLKPNVLEAELLSGVAVTDDASLKQAAKVLLGKGLQQVFITLGPQGVYCADQKQSFRLPVYGSKVVNTTGAGDSFTAALAWGYAQGASLERCAKAGLAAASVAIASASTINEELSAETINTIID